ncbi:hypothetical protein VNI00_006289 [Paramarasmius palmivorus]|uniref:Uncharacterized protein n=1 Tax=Paramarasmius palmivorus TaxID=297713 RepID=A0AAW0D4L3_9AGAR
MPLDQDILSPSNTAGKTDTAIPTIAGSSVLPASRHSSFSPSPAPPVLAASVDKVPGEMSESSIPTTAIPNGSPSTVSPTATDADDTPVSDPAPDPSKKMQNTSPTPSSSLGPSNDSNTTTLTSEPAVEASTEKSTEVSTPSTPSSSATKKLKLKSPRGIVALSPSKIPKKKRVGAPSNFDGPREEYLQEKLKIYKKLPKRSKARSELFRETFVEFIEKFPTDKYPVPGHKPQPPLPEKTEADILAMTANERKAWKRKVKLRSRGEDEYLRDSLTNYFQWHGGDVRGAGKVSVGKFLSSVKSKEKAPKKPSLAQALIKHPQHRLSVIEKSEETSSANRLVARNKAAQGLLKDMPEEDKVALSSEVNESHRKRVEEWKASLKGDEDEKLRYQSSIGRIVQPLLDELHVRTGLNFALLAGLDADGKGHFDSAMYSSQPEGTTKLVNFSPEKLEDFMGFFYLWLNHLAQSQESKDSNASEPGPSSEPARSGKSEKGKSRKGKKARGKAVTDESEDIETDDDDELSTDSDSQDHEGPTEDEEDLGDEDEDGEAVGAGIGGELESSSRSGLSSYEVERANNIARNKMMLKELGLDKPFIESKKAQRPVKKRNPKTTTQPKELRRSTRKKTEVTTYADTELHGAEDSNSNGGEVNSKAGLGDKAQILIDARTKFMSTTMEIPEFVELVNKTLPKDSEEHADWIRHVSLLSEWLVMGEGDCPEIPNINSAIYGDSGEPAEETPTLNPLPPRSPPLDCTSSLVSVSSSLENPVPSTGPTTALHSTLETSTSLPLDTNLNESPNSETTNNSTSAAVTTDTYVDDTNDTNLNESPSSETTNNSTSAAVTTDTDVDDIGMASAETPECSAPTTEQVEAVTTTTTMGLASPAEVKNAANEEDPTPQALDESPCARSVSVVEAYAGLAIGKMRKYAPAGASSSFITDMITYLRADLGPEYPRRPGEWDSVVYLWADVQETYAKLEYKAGRLPTSSRPDSLTWWMRQGRMRGNGTPPPSCKLEEIRSQFWNWWSDINPSSRERHDGYVLPKLEEDLDELHGKAPGKDGIVLTLVLLRWWFDLCGETDERGMCMEALKSVECTLQRLLKDLCNPSPSDSTEDEETISTDVRGTKRRKPSKDSTQSKKPRRK